MLRKALNLENKDKSYLVGQKTGTIIVRDEKVHKYKKLKKMMNGKELK
jgi:hypothetical protein